MTSPQAAARLHLRGLSVVSFAHGVSDFYSGIVPFTIFLVLGRDHVSAGFQGALVALWYLTSSVVQPLFGAYTDRNGRWWFLPAGVAATVVAVSAATTVTSVPLLAACIVAGGLGSAIMHPEAGKYSAMLSGARRASGISIFQIGGQLGYALGPAAVASLYATYGAGSAPLLLVPGACAVAALFVVMPRVDRSAVRMHGAQRVAAAPGPVDRAGVTLLVVATALRHFTTAAFMTYLPNALTARGYTIPAAGEIVTAFLLVSAVGLLAGGSLADRFGAVPISIVALLGAVPLLYGFFALPDALGVLSLMVASALLAVQNAPGVAVAQAMLPKNLGMALGLMNGVAFGAGSALVAGLGAAVATVGASDALAWVSTAPAFGAATYLAVRSRLARA